MVIWWFVAHFVLAQQLDFEDFSPDLFFLTVKMADKPCCPMQEFFFFFCFCPLMPFVCLF